MLQKLACFTQNASPQHPISEEARTVLKPILLVSVSSTSVLLEDDCAPAESTLTGMVEHSSEIYSSDCSCPDGGLTMAFSHEERVGQTAA